MFDVKDEVEFLGYTRRPTRGLPALTKGKVYAIYKKSWTAGYLWVKNDLGIIASYKDIQFKPVKKETPCVQENA